MLLARASFASLLFLTTYVIFTGKPQTFGFAELTFLSLSQYKKNRRPDVRCWYIAIHSNWYSQRVLKRKGFQLRLYISYALLNSSYISGYMFYPPVFIPPRASHAGEIWKHSFISTVTRRTVQIKPSRKPSFSKTLFKLEEFENDAFTFLFLDEKHFVNGTFRRR